MRTFAESTKMFEPAFLLVLASGWLLVCIAYHLAPNSFLQFDVLPRRLHSAETASIVEVLCCLADADHRTFVLLDVVRGIFVALDIFLDPLVTALRRVSHENILDCGGIKASVPVCCECAAEVQVVEPVILPG